MTENDSPDTLKVLVVDDNTETLEIVRRQLAAAGHIIQTAECVEEAVSILEFRKIDLVITDMRMPRFDGLDMVRYVRENTGDTEVIIMTAFPCVESAVRSIKEGATEYLSKPFTEAELLAAVDVIIEKRALRQAARQPSPPLSSYGIIGESESMGKIFSLIEKAAATLATVLISGESGTGKELVARAIHYSSDRASAPFVSVNCTAIPDGLLESELFGHVKGAFTGAKDARTGFFQTADGGTIFLDEIGDASPNMQGKLLRVLQNREIHMVGSSRVRKVDTRIIAATHKDLPALVKKGFFREDLFYRLNVIDIAVPPLRDRREDIISLLHFFVDKYSAELNRPVPVFTDAALQSLQNHAWPGNVRELENVVQRIMVVVDKETIDVADLPDAMRFTVPAAKWEPKTLAAMEIEHILAVMAETEGNKTRAAEILGIDRKTLRSKLKKAGISDEE